LTVWRAASSADPEPQYLHDAVPDLVGVTRWGDTARDSFAGRRQPALRHVTPVRRGYPGVTPESLSRVIRAARTEAQIQADARTRTGDPFITSEVLYQLSYVGAARPV
jgi:hypothetical protein